MKYKILCLILVFCCVITMIGCSDSKNEANSVNTAADKKTYQDIEIVDGWQCVADNGKYSINVDLRSAQFYVENLRTGERFYSSPQDAENLLQGEMLNQVKSLVRVEYLSASGERLSMDNYDYSVSQGKYSVKKLKDGIRFEFTLSKGDITIDMLPKMVEKNKFESKILNKLSSDDKKVIQKRYSLYTKGKSVGGLTWEQIAKKYPEVKKSDYYILSESTPQFDYAKIYSAIFEKSDYTQQDFEDDRTSSEDTVQRAEFFIPLEITLSEYGVTINVPCDELKYSSDFPPIDICLLEYFGAAASDNEGYILVPDGSGALLDFTAANDISNSIRCDVYGGDGAISTFATPMPSEQVIMPFFGIKAKESTFVSLVTQGDAHCFINGRTAGTIIPYQSTNAAFTVTPYDTMTVKGAKEDIVTYKLQNKSYDGNIQVQYMLLQKNDGYPQMASKIREYLIDNKMLAESISNDVSIINIDLLGTAEYKKYFLGIPFDSLYTLTDCNQAIQIVNQLNEMGVQNVSVGYAGWRNGGLTPSVVTRLSVNSEIGGKKGIRSLSEAIGKNNELYLEVPVQAVYSSGLFFNKWSSAVRYTYQRIAEQYPYNTARMSLDKDRTPWQWLSPTLIPKYLDKFIGKFDDLGLSNNIGIFFSDLGDRLNSNFHKSDSIDRQESLEIIKNALAEISDDKKISVKKGNLYTLPYATKITDLSLKSSGYHTEARSVPVTAMVLHSSIPYTGGHINLADDPTEMLLRSIECGAGLSYCWTYASDKKLLSIESDELKNYHSLNYNGWINEAVENYKRISCDMDGLEKLPIINHCYLSHDVVSTTYDDGTIVYVNYSYNDYIASDITIKARDYLVVRGIKNENDS